MPEKAPNKKVGAKRGLGGGVACLGSFGTRLEVGGGGGRGVVGSDFVFSSFFLFFFFNVLKRVTFFVKTEDMLIDKFVFLFYLAS